MKRAINLILSLCILLNLIACTKVNQKHVWSPSINDLANVYIFDYFIRFHPEKGTLNDLPNANNNKLWIPYESRIFEERAAEDSLYNQILQIDPDLLSELDQTTYYNLKERLEALKGLRICNQHLWSFNYLEGFQTDLERVARKQRVVSELEKNALLARWSKVPELIDVEITNNSQGLEQGYALPRPAIEILIDLLGDYLDSPIEKSLFYQPAMISEDPDFQKELYAVVTDSVYPAFSKLRSYLIEVYLPQSRNNYSITNIPYGSECYLAYARYYTSLKLSKEELLILGDSLIQSNNQSLLELGKQVYGVNNQDDILKRFYNDPDNYFSNYDELEEHLESSFALSKREISKFITNPPIEPFKVKRVPKYREGIDANAFYEKVKHEKDTATIYFDYLIHSSAPKGYLESAVFHEGIPGHHLQHSSLRQLKKTHPLNQLIWNAGYSEGWAMYAESVALELGWYSSPKSVLTHYFYSVNENVFLNNFLIYREKELDQLYEIFEKRYNMNRSMTNNVLVYSSTLLGYQLSYGIGNSNIQRIRDRAENVLGENFDLKDFHKECLRHGNIPLTHLERLINSWIDRKKQKN